MSRPRRNTGNPQATVSRDVASSSLAQDQLNFSVKLPASKLKEAIGQQSPNTQGQIISVNSRDQLVSGEIMSSKRQRTVKRSYVVESESDDDDAYADAVATNQIGEDDDEDDEAEAEADSMDEDAEGDIDMDEPPPPPQIKVTKSNPPIIKVKPSGRSDGKTVEQKEMSDDDLSDLESDMEEGMQGGDDDDEEIEVEDDEDDDEEDEFGSDVGTPARGESRASSPDLTKMTKRQRAKAEDGDTGYLMALPDEVQTKKHFTAEEHAMRRAEMARRRKNLSEKRNEEEKLETINKLLKKQAPKTNARRKELNGPSNDDGTVEESYVKPDPAFVRYVSNKQGNSVSIPEEYLDAPVGAIFRGEEETAGRLVQEIA